MTHDIELLMHPEKPVFKDGQVPSEAEIHELLRLRRMERQPELAAQLDEIADWLYDLLGKKGNKDIKGIVRAIHKRCNDWFKVLQRRWPQHKDRHGSVEALLRSRTFMFRFIIVRPANIPESIPREDIRLYEDKVEIAAQEDYRPIVLSDVVESWDRGAPFFNKTWKEVGVTTSMVYHIADEIGVGVMVMQDDILVGKHWPKNICETPEQWVGYNVWGDHGFFYTSDAMRHLPLMKVRPSGKKVLEKRLMQLQENRERTPFVDIEWYDLGDVQKAI